MNFLIDESLSPRLPALLADLGHQATQVGAAGHAGDSDREQFRRAVGYDALITADSHEDAKTRPVAHQAMLRAIRVIYLKQPKSGSFPAEVQAARLARHFDEIERELGDPEGARLMSIIDRGATLKLVSRSEVQARLDERGIDAWPAAGPGGAA